MPDRSQSRSRWQTPARRVRIAAALLVAPSISVCARARANVALCARHRGRGRCRFAARRSRANRRHGSMSSALCASRRVSICGRGRWCFADRSTASWQAQFYELAVRYERPGTIGVRARRRTIHFAARPEHAREPAGQESGDLSALDLVFADSALRDRARRRRFAGGRVSAWRQGHVVGREWDARAAVIDSSPIRGRPFFGDNNPPRMTNVVVGAGVTPHIGLRFGAAVRPPGSYAAERKCATRRAAIATRPSTQVEGEWAFRYTRIAGEFLWTTPRARDHRCARQRRLDRDSPRR